MKRIALFSLVFVACAGTPKPVVQAPSSEPMRAGDFFPLAVGSKWTYEMRATGQVGTQTIEIASEKDGWFKDNLGGSFRVDSTGLRDQDRYLLRDPVEQGFKWSNVESVQSVERHEVLDAGRPCQVKAGTFGRCAVVRSTNQLDARRTFVLESTYAEGVGLVSQRTLQEETGSQPVVVLQRELISFELK